jgi:molybdenum cofactor cytidylyltransferase
MGRIFAVIPAAGRSNRMGRPKQLLDVQGRPMLLAVADPIAACEQVGGVTVVTNSLVAASLDLGAVGASVVLNDEPDAEMIDSVRLGITRIQQQIALARGDGILICPGDQPGLTTDDITRCCQAFSRAPVKIIIATHGDKRGHPMIFPASMIPSVMSNACDTGLRALPEAHADQIVTVECPGPAVLRNVNTPDDYQSLG